MLNKSGRRHILQIAHTPTVVNETNKNQGRVPGRACIQGPKRTAERQRNTRWCLYLIDYAGMRISHPSGSRQPRGTVTCSPEQVESQAVYPWLVGAPDTTRYPAPTRQTKICGSSTKVDPARYGFGARAHRQLDVRSKGRRRPCQSKLVDSRPPKNKTSITADTLASDNGVPNQIDGFHQH